jgi:hypothetical protein
MPFGRLRWSFAGSAPGVKYYQTKPNFPNTMSSVTEHDLEGAKRAQDKQEEAEKVVEVPTPAEMEMEKENEDETGRTYRMPSSQVLLEYLFRVLNYNFPGTY